MIPNNVISILPFYKSLEEQNHRKDYAFKEVFDLITPTQSILPFQIVRDTRVEVASQVTLIVKNIKDVAVMTIPMGLEETGLKINRYPSNGFDIIKYAATAPIEIIAPLIGQHYIELNDGVETFYSEVFTYVDSVADFLKIEFWDAESMEINSGLIDFNDDFKYRVYLNTQVGRPDYEFEEEVTKRDGYQFVEKQVSEKTYKFNFLAPEFLCDAMRIIRMMDNITITSRGNVYTVDQFLITPKWQSGGYYAAVETEFQADTVIKKSGARLIPIYAAEPGANDAKVYVGTTAISVPNELAIKALTELPAIKQNINHTEVLTIGKRFCVAYPAAWGDLTEVNVYWSLDILSVFQKTVMDFTFGTAVVSMNVYLYKSPITYLGDMNPAQTIHYNFTPAQNKVVEGDSYGGGIVVHVLTALDPGYVEGEYHGLIAAPYDSQAGVGAKWSKGPLVLTGSLATELGQGKQNTDNIMISLGPSLSPAYAAYAAKSVGIGDYNDWFLPSKDEFNLVANAARHNWITLPSYYYWTSSEVDANNAWYYTRETPVGFVSELKTKGTLDTGIMINVRAVRYF